jgi:DNA-binding NtrC family response regulator
MTKNSILLIDDEPDITFTIKYFGRQWIQVDSFTDPISALDNYQINFYDFVLYQELLIKILFDYILY